ncbi:MAG: Uma2 family endonuclease [Cyanobacteria bacterium P01_F01_bin.150]
MVNFPYSDPQTDPPKSPRETLPTMFDLPSENPEEPGLPDEFHDLQPQLLSQTCRSPNYSPRRMFTGTDMNVYYALEHKQWYKRPDWFLSVGLSRLYDDTHMRLSYVVWQENINPLVVVELLSPGTESEDLGPFAPDKTEDESIDQHNGLQRAFGNPNPGGDNSETGHQEDVINRDKENVVKPPAKWDVYERRLRVPFYFVFSRYTDELQAFQMMGDSYQKISLNSNNPRVWIPRLGLGLGRWQGEYAGIERYWLRWYDAHDNWISTPEEERATARYEAQLERQRAEDERQRAEAAEAKVAQERREKEELLKRLRQLEEELGKREQ